MEADKLLAPWPGVLAYYRERGLELIFRPRKDPLGKEHLSQKKDFYFETVTGAISRLRFFPDMVFSI